jgi:dihydrofolate reductase
MAIIGIVAVDRNGAIGKGGTLPWHYPADMRFFKEQTTGNACLMGYRTWESLRRPLPGRLNVVLTRRDVVGPRESVVWLRDAQSALSLHDYLKCDLYVIGGARIFEAFRERIDRWLVTEIPLEVEGADTFLPHGLLDAFRPYDSRDLGDGLKLTFYDKPKPGGVG